MNSREAKWLTLTRVRNSTVIMFSFEAMEFLNALDQSNEPLEVFTCNRIKFQTVQVSWRERRVYAQRISGEYLTARDILTGTIELKMGGRCR